MADQATERERLMRTERQTEQARCPAQGEADVDGALLPVDCDLLRGHDRSHYDEVQIVFWGREHPGVEYQRTRTGERS